MKKRAEIVIFVLGLAIILLAGLNSSRFFARLDLTESKAFSISRVSKKLFQEIPEQVYITYYVSEKLRKLYSFPQAIEDLLLEYAAYSRGKIRVEAWIRWPSGEVTRAEQFGVYPQQIEVVERDQRSLAKIYTGIVIQYLDRHETIPVAVRTDALEYELTSRIRKAVSGEDRVVGILLGDAGRDLQQEFGRLTQALGADFRVQPLRPGEDVPDEVDVLFVIGNNDLSEFDLFPIDQYLMRGGRALFAVDGVRVDFMRGLAASKVQNNPTLDMLASYGVKVEPELVPGQVLPELPAAHPGVRAGHVAGAGEVPLLDHRGRAVRLARQPDHRPLHGPGPVLGQPLTLSARGRRQDRGSDHQHPGQLGRGRGALRDQPGAGADAAATRSRRTRAARCWPPACAGSWASFFRGKAIPKREGETRSWAERRWKRPRTRAWWWWATRTSRATCWSSPRPTTT